MELIVAGQRALGTRELMELAFGVGVDAELFVGVEGESDQEAKARLDVAREVLRELDFTARSVARWLMQAGAERGRVQAWKAAA
ncbi:hypothetical protein [Kitasatospora cineracea]|uniref:Uncharacterized protein n=1 Tax=Kitasatospora cineracea TaxID=88074 RepID=A0A3N4RRM6_9ACTN|nr:hypothetical protein [Kitasatospora cineracea]RPE33749.1 hypothetical protein EDD38_2046 [Kitasatospora cineracea]